MRKRPTPVFKIFEAFLEELIQGRNEALFGVCIHPLEASEGGVEVVLRNRIEAEAGFGGHLQAGARIQVEEQGLAKLRTERLESWELRELLLEGGPVGHREIKLICPGTDLTSDIGKMAEGEVLKSDVPRHRGLSLRGGGSRSGGQIGEEQGAGDGKPVADPGVHPKRAFTRRGSIHRAGAEKEVFKHSHLCDAPACPAQRASYQPVGF